MTSFGSATAFCGIFAALFCITFAEIVSFQPCVYHEAHTSQCTIHELRVDPCKEASEGKPCRLKRGRNATISFDYTADFEGETLESYAYWVNPTIDMPFLGMENNACLATPCPVVPGKKQSYSMALLIAKSYPLNTYNVKWQVQNAQKQDCCFVFHIKIHK